MAFYEIILSGPYGDEQVDCELSLTEARECLKEYRFGAGSAGSYRMRRQKPTRFYVKPAAGMAWFDPTPELKQIVRDAGGANVRTARQFGWSNQPEVITFSGYTEAQRAVYDALDDAGYPAQVYEKDWS